jgi:hypothetical protein
VNSEDGGLVRTGGWRGYLDGILEVTDLNGKIILK